MSPYAEGTLVKEQSRAEVYRITDGRKLHIPSASTFDALGFRWTDVRTVPDGALSERPTETWPSHSSTPGSVVWVPDAPDAIGRAVWHALPLRGSREWRPWGRIVRTRELRGWLSAVEQNCNGNDPDWHLKLVLDLGWARAQGIDVNAVLRAGNVLANGIHEPGTSLRARCGVPQIEMEIAGWPLRSVNLAHPLPPPVGLELGPPEPPDWGFPDGIDCQADFGDRRQVKWPFNPLSPEGEELIPAADPLRDLSQGADGRAAHYVCVYGGIVTDNAHIDDDPKEPEEERRKRRSCPICGGRGPTRSRATTGETSRGTPRSTPPTASTSSRTHLGPRPFVWLRWQHRVLSGGGRGPSQPST
jgi:hypothetical protein